MKNVKISIIVPVYNVEKYIDRCLNSLVNQTLKEIEIIIVNDKTPDNSMEICEKYAEKDERIKIYNKDKNEGLGYTRNYGMSKANGEFIAFVDSDDYVDKDFYERLYNKAMETNTDICFAEYKQYLSKKENDIITSKIPFKNDVEKARNVLHNMLLPYNKRNLLTGLIGPTVWKSIYKSSIINENNILFVSEREYIAEDLIFNFDYLMHCKNASFVRGTYYHYCFNESSITHTYYILNRMEKARALKNKLVEQAEKYGELEYLYKEIMSRFVVQTRKAIRQEINCNKSKKETIEIIKKIVNDNDVKIALKNKIKDNFTNEIFNFLIKTKQVRLLILCIKY